MPNAKKFAEALVGVFEDAGLNGISDEMSWSQINTSNEYWEVFLEANAYLGRPAYRFPNDREQNIAFRKRWDEAYDEGQRRKSERPQGVR